MKNDDVLKEVINKFGLKEAVNYCKINAFVYDQMNKDPSNKNEELKYEYSYQNDWWNRAFVNLEHSLQYEEELKK